MDSDRLLRKTNGPFTEIGYNACWLVENGYSDQFTTDC